MPEPVAVPACKNCHANLTGAFCASCGQSADVHVLSTHELIHDALEGLTHSDSRLWRSLRLLLIVPGELTREFIAGRRAAYLPPFRLYLVLSVVFFVLTSFAGHEIHNVVSPDAQTRQWWSNHCVDVDIDFLQRPDVRSRIQRACNSIAKDQGAGLLHAIGAILPKALFILLPLIAFLHLLLYWWPRHRYAEHLLFFVHVHAFVFFAFSLLALVNLAARRVPSLNPVSDVLTTIVVFWLPTYLVLAMKRVFRRTLGNTLFKVFCLFWIYLIAVTFTGFGVFLYALWQL